MGRLAKTLLADADLLEAGLPARFVTASVVRPADRGLIAGRPSPRTASEQVARARQVVLSMERH